MKKMNKFFVATATLVAMLASQVQAQDCCAPPSCCQAQDCAPVANCCSAQDCCTNDCGAYCDSGCASYMAALLPIGALVAAAVIIATTDSGHHSSSSSSSCSSYSFHSHCGCGS